MTDFELMINLFENHLNTISIIMGIVAFVFSAIGIFSYFQIKRYIMNKINYSITENISELSKSVELEEMIEKEINEQISEYGIIVKEVLKDDVKGDQL